MLSVVKLRKPLLSVSILIVLSASSASAWERIVYEDKMTDHKIVWFAATSSSSFQCNVGQSSAQLALGCDGGKPRAMLGTTSCLFFEDAVTRFRLDQNKPDMIWMSPQKSAKAVNIGSLVDHSDGSYLIERVLKGEKLLISVSLEGSVPSNIEFDVSGLDDFSKGELANCLR
jgi:hypothetical protein